MLLLQVSMTPPNIQQHCRQLFKCVCVFVCLSVCLVLQGGERERTTSKVVSNQESADSPVRTYVLQVFLLAAVAQLSRGFKREVFLPFQPVGLHVAFTLERLEGEIQSSDNT